MLVYFSKLRFDLILFLFVDINNIELININNSDIVIEDLNKIINDIRIMQVDIYIMFNEILYSISRYNE